jgi:hypothetical protein
VADRLDVEGGLAGLRPVERATLPNKADAAAAEAVALREEAAELGLSEYEGLPLAELRAKVAAARG